MNWYEAEYLCKMCNGCDAVADGEGECIVDIEAKCCIEIEPLYDDEEDF